MIGIAIAIPPTVNGHPHGAAPPPPAPTGLMRNNGTTLITRNDGVTPVKRSTDP